MKKNIFKSLSYKERRSEKNMVKNPNSNNAIWIWCLSIDEHWCND